MGEIQGFLLDMVKKSTRCRHHDIHPPTQPLNLRVDLDATEDHRRFQRQMFTVGDDALFHLSGQFPRRCQHQSPDWATTLALGVAVHQLQ